MRYSAKTNGALGNRGQAVIGIVLLFLVVSMTTVMGLSRAVYHHVRLANDFGASRSSYYLSEALAEDILYRYMHAIPVGSSPSLTLEGHTASAQVVDISGGKEIFSTGTTSGLYRTTRIRIGYGSGGSFFYGVQIGDGGIHMSNTSSIEGNAFSSGPVKGVGNIIRGDALSSGPAGLIENVHATGSAYAHTIKDATIGKDAYYTTKINTTVGGTSYPNSPDQATASLPLTDEMIDDWAADAAAGGLATCSGGKYVIDSNITIGPKKIPCNLEIQSNPTVTIGGALWVTGDIEFTNNPIIRVSPSFSGATIPIIADNPANRTTSSRVILRNNTEFQGSGDNSYLLLISRNESAQLGGSVDAISMENYVSGEVILYAPHGNITMDNSVNLREVTAYKLTLKNSAQVIYKSGLVNVLFSSGPSGGYVITDWREVE